MSLRVFPCGVLGATAGSIISAVGWIHGLRDPYWGWPGVVNMSFFAPRFDEGDQTIYPYSVSAVVDQIARYANIPFFVSANNYSGDACQFSPSWRAYTNQTRYLQGNSDPTIDPRGNVLSVGATTLAGGADARWQNPWPNEIGRDSGSNAGDCVSVFAPGADSYIAYPVPGSPDPQRSYMYSSGTSFAAPLAAGIAARYIAQVGYQPPYYSVYNYLLDNATSGPSSPATTEYWMCRHLATKDFVWYRTDPGACTYPYEGGGPNRDQPIYMRPSTNSSNAGVLNRGAMLP